MATLKSIGLIFTVQECIVSGVDGTSYNILVPDEIVDKVIDELSKALNFENLKHRPNMISVTNVDATISPILDDLKEKFKKMGEGKSPIEAIVSPLEKYLHFNSDFMITLSISSIIALAGLFLDNVAVIIGAMLISPILGPISLAVVSGSIGKLKSFAKAQLMIFSMIGLAMSLSFILTLVVSQFIGMDTTQQILIRTNATSLDILIAILLGSAGALALRTNLPELLVGVAIAAALVPPVVVMGIGLALMHLPMISGSFFLTIANLLGLELGGMVTLRLKGVTPRGYYQKMLLKRTSYYPMIIIAILVVILVLIMQHQ
jgi:uncharacterized hydrophobic protein (TIGR00341 family)